MNADESADEPQQLTIIFRQPFVRPGTPEAQEQGCLCRFESNLEAGFLSSELEDQSQMIIVIKEGCPLHRIVNKPMDDALGEVDEGGG